ncbi:serine/threonine-protein kinase [Streptomyces sp. NPDC059900]|uniref:WD40 repeat domain-containing serine/threonine protein kinase n=2 Tax=Streptomyces sp. NPDC059900 TaxID=3155816 RepID=UPI00341B3804
MRELGEGGMGQVWEAQDERLGRRVAVKVISLLAGGGRRGDEARARFLREARITARLQHPGIVTIHDLGEADVEGEKVPFLVMELVRGEGLDVLIGRDIISTADAARWGAQIADALDDAHNSGIMHRDIKPSNIFITPTGTVKVLDFGIARAADSNAIGDRLTQTGLIVGTPPYIAPEQARGLPEPRSDLYALGCLLFELLTGRLPFQAPDSMGYLSAHLTQPPPAPSAIRAGIPAAWDDLVLTLLHKDPDQRFANAADLAWALRQLLLVTEPPANGSPWPPTQLDAPATPEPGEYLFATCIDPQGTVRLWDPATARPVCQPLAGHTGTVFRMAFSPDARLLATGGMDTTVRLWDTATGQPVGEPLAGHTATVEDVAFSPDGRLITSAGADATARLWDPVTGQPVGDPLTGHTDAVVGVAISPDGRMVATGSMDTTVRLWDTTTGQPIGEPLTGHTGHVLRMAFSPDGRFLATSSRDWTVRLWESATGRRVGEPLTGNTNTVWEVEFSPDGSQLAAADEDGSVLLWDRATGRLVGHPLMGPADSRVAVARSSGSPLVAVEFGEGGVVRLRDVATGQQFGRLLKTHTGHAVYIALSPRIRRRM